MEMSVETENKIDLKEPWDLNFWCEELNLRAEELKEIIRLVGPKVLDVRIYLAKRLLLSSTLTY
ncbi:MAG: DUF3606 domain-containing protein [Bacteriovoracaceae bacterium]